MDYNNIHNSGHVCATLILNATQVGEHTVFPQKDAAATIYFNTWTIQGWLLFEVRRLFKEIR